jgi:hypothetical protein
MNPRILAATLVAAAAGSAFADDIGVDAALFTGSRTRAEVQAELQQYRPLSGQPAFNPWSHNYDPLQSFRSETTRAQARAAFLAARNEVAAGNGEGGGATPVAHAMRAGASAQ